METPILFKFIKMDLSQFAMFEESSNPETAETEILNRFQFAYDFDEHRVLCKTIIEVSRQEQLLLKADLDCLFKIEAESAGLIVKDGKAVLPASLLAQFASLAYGSMRGVLFLKTSGTRLGNFILPPCELSSVFKEPQTFVGR